MKLLFIKGKKRFLQKSLASFPAIGCYENDLQISLKVENFSKRSEENFDFHTKNVHIIFVAPIGSL